MFWYEEQLPKLWNCKTHKSETVHTKPYKNSVQLKFYLTRMLEDDHPASQAELFGNCPS